ncbi:MAG: hypothetical protein Q7U31_04255, partial [Anaerolineaceae bacterium]|nr:hypothetical protein [Anaerolineaceae bacterium]
YPSKYCLLKTKIKDAELTKLAMPEFNIRNKIVRRCNIQATMGCFFSAHETINMIPAFDTLRNKTPGI